MNKLVKKLLSLTLVVAMCSSTPAVFAGNTTDDAFDPYPVVSRIDLGATLTDPSIATWGGYMFVAHARGLKVVDLQTEEIVSDWTLDRTVIPGVSSFIAKQVYVDDNYIVVTTGASDSAGAVVVFENSKRFDNTPPTLIRRFAHSKIREVKKVYIDEEENLYIFNISSSMLEGWKIPLRDVDSIATTGSAANKYTELSNRATNYEQFTTSKVYDRIWSDVEISDGWAYVPVFNDEANAPYKTIMMLAIDLENFSEDYMITNILAEGDIDALKTRLITTQITDAQVRNSWSVYLTDDPETKVDLTTRTFARSNLRMGMINLGPEYCMVTMYFTDLATVGAKLGATEEQLRSGEKVLAIEVDGEEYTFDLTTKVDVDFPDGSFVMAGSNFYLLTDTTSTDFIFYGDVEQGICSIENLSSMLADNNNSGFTGAVLTNNQILGFIRGVNSTMYGIDLGSLNDDYVGTYQVRQYTGDSMSDANLYSDLVEYNGSIYFVSRSRTQVIHLGGSDKKETVNKVQADNKLPVVLYGTTANDTEITVTVDGEDITVPVQNNIWRLPVAAQTNGAHIATIDGKDVAYSVSVQPVVQVTNVAAGDAFTMDATANLADYGYNADTLYVGVNKVKVDGSVVGAGAEVAVTDGQTTPVSVPVDNTDAATYEIYVFIKENTQLIPIAKYTYQNGAMTAEAPDSVLGNASEIAIDSVVTDNVNRVAKISGTVENGGARLVVAKLDCDHGITFAGAISDATGAYTLTAPYTCNSADVNDVTNVSVYAQLSSAVGNDSYSALDEGAVADIVARAKAEITSAAEMKNYLAANADVAAVIGVDLAQEDFAKLNPDNQTAVLNKVYALLMQDSINEIPGTFETESKSTLATQRTEEALDKVSKATSSTLTAILREYKTELGISDTLWNAYDDLTNNEKATANDYFLDNVKVNNPAGIPDVLEDAVDEAENPSVKPTKRPSRDIGVSTPISNLPVTTPKPTTTPAPTPTPTTEPTGFVDLAGYEWAEESINALAELGIITGVGDNKFAPGNNVTREQFVTMLVKAAGLDNTDAVSTFTDVNPDDWFYTSVAMGEEAGLVAGSDGKFGVGKKISRQDMAVFIYRAGVSLGVEFDGQKLDYVDAAEISDYAVEAVGAVSAAGIMSGVGDNTFAPKGDCTRAMAARVIYGLLQLMK